MRLVAKSQGGSLNPEYDLAVIGAGSGGLTAASFAARAGAKVALIEKARVGGDCTWTGCVPSKALLKAAKVAHQARTAGHYGIAAGTPAADMLRVRDFVRRAIEQVYRAETPEELRAKGIDVILGAARFVNSQTVAVGDRHVIAKSFLIATGAVPNLPNVAGLEQVPYFTYETLFENDKLPRHLIVVGAGPIGVEMGQAYRRLGSEVTIVDRTVLPKEEPETRESIQRVFEREGIRIARGRAISVSGNLNEITVATDSGEVRGDMLLAASGRTPNVVALDLANAGVHHSEKGIPVDDRLRTNVKHIYAAGDVLGGYQFTHLAGWQAFQAARNALFPGHDSGFTEVLPRVTFTDPEAAQVGLTEEQARGKFGDAIKIRIWEMKQTDRAICEGDAEGFIKVIEREHGTLLGATVVAARAGEMIMEFALALKHGWKATDLASIVHPYPTYSTAIQQLTADMAVEHLLSGVSGRLLRGVSKLIR
jgi:pyruvate/2-oxoglutarate dehydrogenase complex dihydrolipoamide dehydrogenase (E3) component